MRRWSACLLVVASGTLGCSQCRKKRAIPAPPHASAVPLASSTSASPSPANDPVHGIWSQRPFYAKSGVANLYPKWVTITLIDREARCDSAVLRESDMAIQFTLPSGPDASFYAGFDVPIRLQLNGAGGVSSVPAGNANVRIEPFDTISSESIRGHMNFRFRTALDDDAPVYHASGDFEARLCNNGPVEPSVPPLDASRSPIGGNIAGRNVRFGSVHAYLRDDGEGNDVLMLKAYELDVACHSTRSATPYLFGADVGAGPKGDFHKGVPMPVRWSVQMRMDDFSERTVQSDHGSGWLQLDQVALNGRGVFRGSLIAANADEDKRYRFELSGRFQAKLCGRPVKAW